ncbi:MAG: lysine--tRNA ligase [Puniceicoccales bacterium]|jgi:lysyl-tRNA synthetase class 2|nr:lysine--tRNA ligase [Puniceicoccales bacterium]
MQDRESSELIAIRRNKLVELRRSGFDPFRQNWDQQHTSAQAKELFGDDGDSVSVSVAGRIVAYRLMGKASFINLLDRDGHIQLYVSQDDIGEDNYKSFKKLDIGDIVGAKGRLFKTKTDEITVRVDELRLLSKSMRPLPEKWHGLADDEQIYRQRYLDLIVNQKSRFMAFKRTEILKEIRRFLWNREFTEVETPMLQNIPGGAAAKPFVTHMNALDHDFYLRISLELFLKRMLVAGFDRVFEMGRVFRNEGLSRKHNPEFTMIELYQAYSDHRGMMSLIYDLIQHLCKTVLGKTKLTRYDGKEIELSGKWREETYGNLVIEATNDGRWFSRTKEEKIKACKELGVEASPDQEDYEITDNVFGKLVEPNLIQPTFVLELPKELCPLAKLNQENPKVLDVFELCINGQEIAPSYSEQNDPFIQREMFEAQLGEERQNLDNEFLLALEYGMPPAGGMGIGIDRLVILLTEADNIRDTILYPTLKPLAD